MKLVYPRERWGEGFLGLIQTNIFSDQVFVMAAPLGVERFDRRAVRDGTDERAARTTSSLSLCGRANRAVDGGHDSLVAVEATHEERARGTVEFAGT
jgi:hypothetical protein